MNKKFVDELIQLNSLDQIQRKLIERRDEILQGIEDGKIAPESDAMSELAELNIAIGDVPEGGAS